MGLTDVRGCTYVNSVNPILPPLPIGISSKTVGFVVVAKACRDVAETNTETRGVLPQHDALFTPVTNQSSPTVVRWITADNEALEEAIWMARSRLLFITVNVSFESKIS